MVYDGGNNCQQYENEINKSTVARRKRNEGCELEKKEGFLRKSQIDRRQDGMKQERQRQWGRNRRGRKKEGRKMKELDERC